MQLCVTTNEIYSALIALESFTQIINVSFAHTNYIINASKSASSASTEFCFATTGAVLGAAGIVRAASE